MKIRSYVASVALVMCLLVGVTGEAQELTAELIQQALDLYQQFKQRGYENNIGIPTLSARQFALEMSIKELAAFGQGYDDSWVRPYLGYDNPESPVRTRLELQLVYARHRMWVVGRCDPAWTPAPFNIGDQSNLVREFNQMLADFNSLCRQMESISNTLTPEERRFIEALNAFDARLSQ